MQETNSSFFGASRSWTTTGARALASSYPSGLHLDRHEHERAHLCLVLSGSYEESLEGRRELRGPMSLVYYPPQCPHAETHRKSGKHLLIEWDDDWARRHDFHGRLPDGPLSIEDSPTVFALLRAYRDWQGSGDNRPSCVDATVAEALGGLARLSNLHWRREPRWMCDAVELIENPNSHELSLAGMAARVGVHPAHFARSFRQFQGCTLGEFRRRVRIRQVYVKLTTSDDPLSQVAVEAGFADQSHMTRVLRRATGFTPQALRIASADC